jgi:c-di-GMP-related signal transduction protein
VGRQPLYDLDGNVAAFELLFRGGALEQSAARSDAHATADVIVHAFTEFGLADLVGDRLCFVNLTREFLVGTLPVPFGPEQTVLEVLETISIDEDVIEGAVHLAQQGYAIALDDFVWGSGHERLLELASFVKLDVLGSPWDELRQVAHKCARFPRIRLVGERLESEEDIRFARRLGCQYLQGYALGRPRIISTAALSSSRIRQMQLLAALSRESIDVTEVVSIVTLDPALSYRLLRLSNSAAAGPARRLSSVHEAVMMVGTRQVREWVALMLLSDIANADEARLAEVVARGRMCQLVAEQLGAPTDPAFTAGLLIGVSELLGTPAAELITQLPLSQDLTDALTTNTGPLGIVVKLVDQYHAANQMEQLTDPAPVPLAEMYLSAIGWSTRAVAKLALTNNGGGLADARGGRSAGW